MTPSSESRRVGWRLVAAGALVVLNLVLVALNLERHDIFPFSADQTSDVESSNAIVGPPPPR